MLRATFKINSISLSISNVFKPFLVRVSAYQPFIALYVYALLLKIHTWGSPVIDPTL